MVFIGISNIHKGEELMMRMKEGHTEMETISPTGTDLP